MVKNKKTKTTYMLLTNDHIYEIQTEKGSNERLFILSQNDAYATDKRSKTIKKIIKNIYTFVYNINYARKSTISGMCFV